MTSDVVLVSPGTCYRCDRRSPEVIGRHPVAPLHRPEFGSPAYRADACYRAAQPRAISEVGRDLLAYCADRLASDLGLDLDTALDLAWHSLAAVIRG